MFCLLARCMSWSSADSVLILGTKDGDIRFWTVSEGAGSETTDAERWDKASAIVEFDAHTCK